MLIILKVSSRQPKEFLFRIIEGKYEHKKRAEKKTIDSKNQAAKVDFFSYEDMQFFLYDIKPQRFALLDVLYKSGPMPFAILATILRRDDMSIRNDLIALACAGLIAQNDQGQFFVRWKGIVITVQQNNQLVPKNVYNLAEWYLYIYAKKYRWLKVRIKTTVILSGPATFLCTLVPVSISEI
jgi:predicted transcriptional regulator